MSWMMQGPSGLVEFTPHILRGGGHVDVGMSVTTADILQRGCLDDLKAAGVTWVRTDCYWGYIEGSKGTYDWGDLPAAVDAILAAGMKPLLILQTQPSWSSGVPVSQSRWEITGPATDQQVTDYARFCGVAAAKFKGKVRCWEIWNEPNLDQFWGPLPNAALFVQIIKAGSAAIRAEDPSVTVISGGLGDGPAPDIRVDDYLTQMWAADPKLADHIDGFGIHHYTQSTGVGIEGVDSVVASLKAHGYPDKPVWLTETGTPTRTATANWAGLSSTEAGQGDVLVRIAKKFRDTTPDGSAFFFYEWRDRDTGLNGDSEGHFGVMRHTDGTKKPAYDSISAIVGGSSWEPVHA